MSKKIDIKLKDNKELEFELCSDAKSGDYICLNDINKINLDETKKFFNDLLEKEKSILEKEWVTKYRESLWKEFNNSEEILKLKLEKNDYENNFDIKLENEKLKINQQFEKQIQQLKNENTSLTQHYELEKKELENKYNNEINRLKYERKNLNIKILGELFEQSVINEINEHFNWYEDVCYYKANDIKGKSKPDFIFSIVNKEDKKQILGSIVIEAKAAQDSGTTKNKTHFDKLEKDRNNNKCDYAILVTELEPEDKFSIKRIKQYNNMFMVRLEFLNIILDLLRIIIIEKEKLIDKTQVLHFKKQQEIIAEFNEFKNKILNKYIMKIIQRAEEVKKEAVKILDSANKIIESSTKILDKELISIQNEIINFNIDKKIVKQIDKLELQDETNLVKKAI